MHFGLGRYLSLGKLEQSAQERGSQCLNTQIGRGLWGGGAEGGLELSKIRMALHYHSCRKLVDPTSGSTYGA